MKKPVMIGMVLDLPYFPQYHKPAGTICHDNACHALFYYALTARNAYEENVLERGLQYEDTLTNQSNFPQMFKNIARMYGVQQEDMAKHWVHIDTQLTLLSLPTLPDEERYRFNRPLIVRLH